MLSKIYTFFLIIPPGFETLALMEMEEKWHGFFPTSPVPKTNIIHGGISLDLPLEQGCLLNLILKIPNRILLRVKELKCRDFPKLFKNISKIEWRNFFTTNLLPEISSSSHNSRLFDSRRIEKSVIDGLNKYWKANPPKKSIELKTSKIPLKIYIRFENDVCTLSIDTSGEKLHLRSYRKYISQAPIRENLAAALVYQLKKFSTDPSYDLIDPMCGAGTFLLESCLFNYPNLKRDYVFLHFSSFKNFKIPDVFRKATRLPLFSKNLGLDIEDKAISASIENQREAEIDNEILNFSCNDLFSKKGEKLSTNNVVISNPPYGKRLKTDQSEDQYFKRILSSIVKKYSPHIIGLIVPASTKPNSLELEHYKSQEIISFRNGGLKVNFIIFLSSPDTI